MQPLDVSKGSLIQNSRFTDLLPGKKTPNLLSFCSCVRAVILKIFPLRLYFWFLGLCRLMAMSCPLKRLCGLVWPQQNPISSLLEGLDLLHSVPNPGLGVNEVSKAAETRARPAALGEEMCSGGFDEAPPSAHYWTWRDKRLLLFGGSLILFQMLNCWGNGGGKWKSLWGSSDTVNATFFLFYFFPFPLPPFFSFSPFFSLFYTGLLVVSTLQRFLVLFPKLCWPCFGNSLSGSVFL